MNVTRIAYFQKRLSEIETALKNQLGPFYAHDLIPLTLDILDFAKSHINFQQLDTTITAQEDIDLDALETAYKVFDKIDFDAVNFKDYEGKAIDLKDRYQKLGELISNLKAQRGKLSRIEVLLRLELLGDSCFSILLMNPDNPNTVYETVKSKIKEKIGLLDNEGMLKMWGYIENEVSDPTGPEDAKIRVDESIVKKSFFKLGTYEEARDKITDYIARIRPNLIRSMFQKGPTRTPMQVPGVAKVLSWNSPASSYPLSSIHYTAYRTACRIAYLWLELPGAQLFINVHDKAVLAKMISVSETARIFDGPETEEIEKLCTKNNRIPKQDLLIVELNRLLDIASQFGNDPIPTESALRQYKLGIEVMCPEIITEFKKKGELRLQKEMCRFLLEKGIYSAGTKFGPNELDLMVYDPHETILIETKIYKKLPSDAVIKKHLVQLQTYMDQAPLKHRGILVVFNFTNTLITSPQKWLHGRYWVLIVNLVKPSASSRLESLEIEESETDVILIRRVKKFSK